MSGVEMALTPQGWGTSVSGAQRISSGYRRVKALGTGSASYSQYCIKCCEPFGDL